LDDLEFIRLIEKMGMEMAYRSSADTKKYLEEAYVQLGKMAADFKIPREVEKK